MKYLKLFEQFLITEKTIDVREKVKTVPALAKKLLRYANEENEDGDGGDGEFDSDDEMVRGGGDGDWDSGSQAREKTPAYVERLYSPRTPPTWPKEVRLLLPLLLFLLLVVVVP